jgi:hypothetical protein
MLNLKEQIMQLYCPEDRASRFLGKVGSTVPKYTASLFRFTAELCSLDLLILNLISFVTFKLRSS